LKPVDKFGNPIYSTTWEIMRKNAKTLHKLGYVESSSKPNLFLRKHENGVFFADMRGTDVVKIWEDTCPLMYFKFSHIIPDWRKRRIVKYELRTLLGNGCECRLSFYEMAEPEGLMFDSDQDGYCAYCGNDFRDNGIFCSTECQEQNYMDSLPECSVCNEKMKWNSLVRHHVSYDPEETKLVCRSCHSRIHNAHRWILKPPEEASKEFYRKKDKSDEPKVSRGEQYFISFRKGLKSQVIADEMGVKLATVQKWRRKWAERGDPVNCGECGQEFNTINRTTCPHCRAFFR
jgi:hypothetical protein